MLHTDMKDKTVLITHCETAVGKALCEAFSACGAKVVACCVPGSRSDGLAAEAVYTVDFSARASLVPAAEEILAAWGKIDVLVLNELTCLPLEKRVPLHEMDMADWDAAVAGGIKGLVTFAQRILKSMSLTGGGSAVTVTSIRGLVPVADQTPVVGTAAALIGMTKMWGVELRDANIRVNGIAVGVVEGDPAVPGSEGDKFYHQAVMRPCKPEEAAAAALFLASDEAAYITGAVLPVDGGMSAGYVRSF